MHQTRNDLQANTRSVAIDLLNARLADVIDLALLTKQAHWNLKGPRFIAIHEMLDGFRDQIDEYTDTMAERVAQLGGTRTRYHADGGERYHAAAIPHRHLYY